MGTAEQSCSQSLRGGNLIFTIAQLRGDEVIGMNPYDGVNDSSCRELLRGWICSEREFKPLTCTFSTLYYGTEAR